MEYQWINPGKIQLFICNHILKAQIFASLSSFTTQFIFDLQNVLKAA